MTSEIRDAGPKRTTRRNFLAAAIATPVVGASVVALINSSRASNGSGVRSTEARADSTVLSAPAKDEETKTLVIGANEGTPDQAGNKTEIDPKVVKAANTMEAYADAIQMADFLAYNINDTVRTGQPTQIDMIWGMVVTDKGIGIMNPIVLNAYYPDVNDESLEGTWLGSQGFDSGTAVITPFLFEKSWMRFDPPDFDILKGVPVMQQPGPHHLQASVDVQVLATEPGGKLFPNTAYLVQGANNPVFLDVGYPVAPGFVVAA